MFYAFKKGQRLYVTFLKLLYKEAEVCPCKFRFKRRVKKG